MCYCVVIFIQYLQECDNKCIIFLAVPLPLDKRICLVGSVKEDPVTCRAAQAFGIPILTSDTGLEYVNDVSCTTIFILDDFEGSNVKELHKNPHRILGSIGLQQLADKKEKLPNNTRPLYNMAMIGVVVCFTGFRKKEDLVIFLLLLVYKELRIIYYRVLLS